MYTEYITMKDVVSAALIQNIESDGQLEGQFGMKAIRSNGLVCVSL